MSKQLDEKRSTCLEFGPFRLLADHGQLLEAGKPVRIGSRALHILVALVSRSGELVKKDELIAAAWPTTIVDETNLRVHVAGLRKLLGDGQGGARFIVNESGRGYRFVAPVKETRASFALPPAFEQTYNLPSHLSRMLGRSEIVASLADHLQGRRLITIVGPGGIGKTTVALAVAHELVSTYEQGVWFVDLASLADPQLVIAAVAAVLGVSVQQETPLNDLVAFLRNKHLLLVLDSCEHVLEAAASLVEYIMRGAPLVQVLVTSREPLRAEHEYVQRLAPLGLPEGLTELSAANAMTFPAIALFVERVSANLDGFELSDIEAPVVGEICRKLDGIPLAIELAAGRVDTFGVRGVADLLDDRFRLLTGGRRTALPRHQTLSAALDWSYDVLPEKERALLRRLGVFTGAFTLEAAGAVTANAQWDVIDPLSSLVAKSLVVANISGTNLHYRLLNTTRAYAVQKLTQADELDVFARRHAEYYLSYYERANSRRSQETAAEWTEAEQLQIDNVGSALDWAFSRNGDAGLGVALTLSAAPIWVQLSRSAECQLRIEQAAAILTSIPNHEERLEMRLFAELGGALLVNSSSDQDAARPWNRVLTLARNLNDIDHQLRALWGLWVSKIKDGEYLLALPLAENFRKIAASSGDAADPLIGDRIVGFTHFCLGDATAGRLSAERMLANYVPPPNGLHIMRYQFDQRVLANVTLSTTLWLLGFADQATRIAAKTVQEAATINHPYSLGYAIAQAGCPVALFTGDLPAADRYVRMLLEHISRYSQPLWTPWARCLEGILRIKSGEPALGTRLLDAALDGLQTRSFHLRYIYYLGELADGFCHLGDPEKGLATINKAISQADGKEERWCMAELLRIKGDVLLRASGSDSAKASEEYFQSSLDWARRQSAIAWELRTAMSLAQLWQTQGRYDGLELVKAAYARFTEGFDTADLRAAKEMIDSFA